MTFIKYPHLERVGKEDVEGILAGDCYIFPKIDGTNASAWMEDKTLCGGSRNRNLTLESDNAGFYEWLSKADLIHNLFTNNPNLRLYGEWLVPHTFKEYRDDSWRKFYVFDVAEIVVNADTLENELRMLPYEEYKIILDTYGVDYIPAQKILRSPNEEELRYELENNFFLCKDNTKPGEGIVIKNYDFKNKWGRQTWAKMVREEFKEGNLKLFGTPNAGELKVEQEIVEKYVTKAFCEKECNKILNPEVTDGEPISQKKIIPRVLETIWHEFVTEEIWNMLKEHNNPTINFKMLKALCIRQTKKNLPNLF